MSESVYIDNDGNKNWVNIPEQIKDYSKYTTITYGGGPNGETAYIVHKTNSPDSPVERTYYLDKKSGDWIEESNYDNNHAATITSPNVVCISAVAVSICLTIIWSFYRSEKYFNKHTIYR